MHSLDNDRVALPHFAQDHLESLLKLVQVPGRNPGAENCSAILGDGAEFRVSHAVTKSNCEGAYLMVVAQAAHGASDARHDRRWCISDTVIDANKVIGAPQNAGVQVTRTGIGPI